MVSDNKNNGEEIEETLNDIDEELDSEKRITDILEKVYSELCYLHDEISNTKVFAENGSFNDYNYLSSDLSNDLWLLSSWVEDLQAYYKKLLDSREIKISEIFCNYLLFNRSNKYNNIINFLHQMFEKYDSRLIIYIDKDLDVDEKIDYLVRLMDELNKGFNTLLYSKLWKASSLLASIYEIIFLKAKKKDKEIETNIIKVLSNYSLWKQVRGLNVESTKYIDEI